MQARVEIKFSNPKDSIMVRNIFFISPQLMKDRSLVDDNVDDKLLEAVISDVHYQYLEPILGTTLFRALQDRVDGGTTTANDRTLLDRYVIHTLFYYTLASLPVPMGFKFFNKNVLSKSDNQANAMSMSDLVDISNSYLHKAQNYAQRLIQYLKEASNTGLFTEYINWTAGLDIKAPIHNAYTTSVYLGDEGNCCGRPFERYYQGNNYHDPNE
jgi:hypothetical protein